MSTEPAKLMPTPNPESEAFWQGCNEGRLLIQRCGACGHHQFYPRLLCTGCASVTIIRRPVTEAYAADVPYVVALIELAEGPTMMSNVIGCDAEDVRIGMEVSVQFERRTSEIAVPVFTAA